MHPRNLYNKKPDFGELATFRPSLKPFLILKSKKSPSKQCSHQLLSQSDTAVDTSPDYTPSSALVHSTSHSPPQLVSLSPSELSEATSPSKTVDVKHKPGGKFAYTLDFSNPAALRELTCAVLEKDFGLRVELPLDMLIPAVPQRLNYIHWIEDLLVCGRESREEKGSGLSDCDDVIIPKGDSVIGIDIGTGASCIYPLLGTRLNGWRFLATEIDEEAVKYARENVTRNDLKDKIEVKQVPPSTILLDVVDEAVQYSFCMCNPPFFRDREDRYGGGGATRSELRPPPSTFSSGTLGETVTEGGEVEFVKRIIHDSLVLRSKVRWYSTMLGKKTSVKQILTELKRHKVPVMTTTEFVQGKTWRWAVAWSFDVVLKDKVGHLTRSSPKKALKRQRPLVLQLQTVSSFNLVASFNKARDWLLEHLRQLKIDYTYIDSNKEGGVVLCEREGRDQPLDPFVFELHCVAKRNTWSHQRKRRRLMEKLEAQQSLTTQVSRETETDKNERESQGNKNDGEQFPSASANKPARFSTDPQVIIAPTSFTHQLANTMTSSLPNKSPTQPAPPEEMRSMKTVASDDSMMSPDAESCGSFKHQLTSETEVNLIGTDRKKTISEELDSLCPPCELEFKCSLLTESVVHDSHCRGTFEDNPESDFNTGKRPRLDDKKSMPVSKRKNSKALKSDANGQGTVTIRDSGKGAESAEGGASECQLFIEFEWISGENKDLLHQVIQYLKNKSQTEKF